MLIRITDMSTTLTIPVSGVNKLKAVGLHRVWSEYDGQVLIVDGELPQSNDDSSSLLEELLAIPVRV